MKFLYYNLKGEDVNRDDLLATYDFAALAERKGWSERERASKLAEMFGLSAIQMRRILNGAVPPSTTLIVAARALDRVVELEMAEQERARADLDDALKALEENVPTGETTDEVLDDTRQRHDR